MIEINSKAVRNRMIETGVNVKTLANNAKVSITTAQKLVSKGGKVQFQTIGRVAKTLEVAPQEIIKDYA